MVCTAFPFTLYHLLSQGKDVTEFLGHSGLLALSVHWYSRSLSLPLLSPSPPFFPVSFCPQPPSSSLFSSSGPSRARSQYNKNSFAPYSFALPQVLTVSLGSLALPSQVAAFFICHSFRRIIVSLFLSRTLELVLRFSVHSYSFLWCCSGSLQIPSPRPAPLTLQTYSHISR